MTTLTAVPDMERLKSGLKSTWMAGDYDRFSRFMEGSARDFYERIDVAPGTPWIEVRTVLLAAARAGTPGVAFLVERPAPEPPFDWAHFRPVER